MNEQQQEQQQQQQELCEIGRRTKAAAAVIVKTGAAHFRSQQLQLFFSVLSFYEIKKHISAVSSAAILSAALAAAIL